jgi:DNA-binding MarR family transcriptional regulator
MNEEELVRPPRLDEQLCFALYACANAITRAYQPHLKALGLTYPQYLVMMVLWESPQSSVGEIGRRLHLDSGTLTPLLKRLEAAGMVRRERSRHDERQVEVRLTEAGNALSARAHDLAAAAACRVQLQKPELEALREQLKKLRSQL